MRGIGKFLREFWEAILDELAGGKCLNGTRGCWGRCCLCIRDRIKSEEGRFYER